MCLPDVPVDALGREVAVALPDRLQDRPVLLVQPVAEPGPGVQFTLGHEDAFRDGLADGDRDVAHQAVRTRTGDGQMERGVELVEGALVGVGNHLGEQPLQLGDVGGAGEWGGTGDKGGAECAADTASWDSEREKLSP